MKQIKKSNIDVKAEKQPDYRTLRNQRLVNNRRIYREIISIKNLWFKGDCGAIEIIDTILDEIAADSNGSILRDELRELEQCSELNAGFDELENQVWNYQSASLEERLWVLQERQIEIGVEANEWNDDDAEFIALQAEFDSIMIQMEQLTERLRQQRADAYHNALRWIN